MRALSFVMGIWKERARILLTASPIAKFCACVPGRENNIVRHFNSITIHELEYLVSKLTMIGLEINVLQHFFHLMLLIFHERVEYVVYCTRSHINADLYRLGYVS
jgi:hypothetical protein